MQFACFYKEPLPINLNLPSKHLEPL
jgi:hypothetical protein